MTTIFPPARRRLPLGPAVAADGPGRRRTKLHRPHDPHRRQPGRRLRRRRQPGHRHHSHTYRTARLSCASWALRFQDLRPDPEAKVSGEPPLAIPRVPPLSCPVACPSGPGCIHWNHLPFRLVPFLRPSGEKGTRHSSFCGHCVLWPIHPPRRCRPGCNPRPYYKRYDVSGRRPDKFVADPTGKPVTSF